MRRIILTLTITQLLVPTYWGGGADAAGGLSVIIWDFFKFTIFKIFKLIFRYPADPDDLEDFTEEAIEELMEKLNTGNLINNFSTYFYKF